MQKTLVILLLLTLPLSNTLNAQETASDANYKLSDPANQLHFVAAYAFTLTETLILEKYKVPRWKAILISVATTMALGYAKEQWIDSSFSKKDLYMDAGGAVAASLFVIVFKL